MESKVQSINEYLNQLPEDKAEAVKKLHQLIIQTMPKGFEACMNYGMIGYVVPHQIYPQGYHCDPKLPLPFMSLAAQKNAISFYHMGIYADENLMNWFKEEYAKLVKTKLDMGKSCIRLKKPDQIPFDLIKQLVSKMTPKDWIQLYEQQLKK